MKRKSLSRDQREASCLLAIKRGDGSWLIPEPLRSTGTPKEIIASVEYDHGVPHAITADDRPQNVTPLARRDHAAKTKRDVAQIAKTKRLEKEHADFKRRILSKTEDHPIDRVPHAKRSWPSKKMSKPDGVKYDWKSGKYRQT